MEMMALLNWMSEHWTGIATMVTSGLGVLSSLANRKKIHQVHHLFNGRLTDFLEAERKLAQKALEDARAEGYERGRAEVQAERVEKLAEIIKHREDPPQGYQG